MEREKIIELAVAAANKHGVTPARLVALLEHESAGFDPAVLNHKRSSSAGAFGIAQFMPATGREFGVVKGKPDVEKEIDAAAKYMSRLTRSFNDEALAVQAYNWGQGNMRKYLAAQKAGRTTGANSRLPKETQTHTARINNLMQTKYAGLGGSAPAAGAQLSPPDASGRIALPDDITPSTAGAGRGVVSPPVNGADLVRQSMDEINQGLPPGSSAQPAVPMQPQGAPDFEGGQSAQSAGQDPMAWLKMLAGQGGAPTAAPTASAEAPDLFDIDALRSRAVQDQERTMAAMFADTNGAAVNDTSRLPGAVDRYLERMLES